MSADEVRAAAADLIGRANREPSAVRRRAQHLLDTAEVDSADASVLWRAVGLTLRVERRPNDAIAPLLRAVEAGERAGDDQLTGLALLSLALAEAYQGKTREARTTIDRAVDNLTGLDRADARFQRGLISQLIGDHDAALADYRAALPVFRRTGRFEWEADLLTNRGIVHAYRGAHLRAERDFQVARGLFAETADDIGMASMDHNLAWLAALRGNVVEALAAYGRAEAALRAVDFPIETVAIDHCEALISAGLFAQAAERAALAAHDLGRRGMELERAELLVVLAEACAYNEDVAKGQDAIGRARELLANHGQPSWELRAKVAAVRLHDGTVTAEEAAETIADLEGAGLGGWAKETTILVAREMTADGDLEGAEALLATLSPRSLPPELTVAWWLGTAQVRRLQGRSAAALTAARAGVRAVRRRQQASNTSEVRAHIGHHLGELATIGIDLAIGRDDPHAVLDWSQQLAWTPPPSVAAPSAEVRSVTFELRATTHELLRDVGLDSTDRRRELARRQRRLHRQLRAALEAHPPSNTSEITTRTATTRPRPDQQLRCYAVSDGRLALVHNRDGRLTIDHLGPVGEVTGAARIAGFRLRSHMQRGEPGTWDGVLAAADQLDELLGRPGAGSDGALTIFFPPEIGSFPVNALPSTDGQRVVMTGSPLLTESTANAASPHRPRNDNQRRPLTAVAGPALTHAEREAALVAGTHDRGTALVGQGATCAAVRQAAATSRIVHIAAHARRSADNPFFDAIDLVDGPLFTHELDWIEPPPDTVVLAACEAAVEHSVGKSQRLGLTPSLERVGVRRTVAGIYPLPDADDTVAVMHRLHLGLAGGQEPEAALVDCIGAFGLQSRARAIAQSLVCSGPTDAGRG